MNCFFAYKVEMNRLFVALYRRRQAALYRFVMHMSGSASVAEDVVQEVFLALIRQECGFDPERGRSPGICLESPANWYCAIWSEAGPT